jgi:hypothetical protein
MVEPPSYPNGMGPAAEPGRRMVQPDLLSYPFALLFGDARAAGASGRLRGMSVFQVPRVDLREPRAGALAAALF